MTNGSIIVAQPIYRNYSNVAEEKTNLNGVATFNAINDPDVFADKRPTNV